MPEPNPVPRWFPVGLLVWLGLAVAAGASGRVAMLRPPAPQLVVAALTVLLVLAGRMAPGLAAWLRTIDPRAGIALHLIRFVGIYFLILESRNELAAGFAIPGGIGDTAVAILAVGLLVASPAAGWWRRAALAWNVLGLLDILFVVVSAARLGRSDPAGMAPLLRLPLSLLPTFIVPLIIGSHLWLFGRLRSAHR